MKTILTILASCLLSACASQQFHTVAVSGDGDYYIAERGNGSYYDPASASLAGIGLYPWWITADYFYPGNGGYPFVYGGYPYWGFAYYSPYFYPHHFSVWYPPGYPFNYGWYGGPYPYWCPPFRTRRQHAPVRIADGSNGTVSEAPPVSGSAGSRAPDPELLRAIYRKADERELVNSRRTGSQPQATVQRHRYAGSESTGVDRDGGPAVIGRRGYNRAHSQVAPARSTASDAFSRSTRPASPAAAAPAIQRGTARPDRASPSHDRQHN
jgi:hypothetical protein